MSYQPRALLLTLICGLGPAAAALAFEPPETAPATTPATPPAPAKTPPPEEVSLGGPKVKPAEAERTLVHREMNGALVRLEERPETAALNLLKLTKEQRTAADDLLVKRGALVSKTLSANMELFLELQGARQSGNRDNAQKLMMRMRDAAKDLLDPPLVDSLAAAVGEEQGKELHALVDEYFGALAIEETKPADSADGADKPDTAPVRPRAAAAAAAQNPRLRMRTELNLTVREMARTLAATVAERNQRMDALLKAAEATPEQETKIRAIMRAGNAGGQPPSQEAREETTRKILAELSPEQREKYLKAARSR